MSNTNLDTVHRFWNSINKKDVESYLNTFAEDAVAWDPADQPALRTEDDRRAFMSSLLDGFSEIHANLDFVTPCGSSTAAKWTVRGLTTGGDPVHLEGIDIYDHAPDGRISTMRGYFQM